MSTKRAQKLIKDTYDLKTAEGISKVVDVKYTMKQWAENMEAYLRSAMSYANIKDIKDFNPENVTLNIISNETQRILLK